MKNLKNLKLSLNNKQFCQIFFKNTLKKRFNSFLFFSASLFDLLKNSFIFYKKQLSLFELNTRDTDVKHILYLSKFSKRFAFFEIFYKKVLIRSFSVFTKFFFLFKLVEDANPPALNFEIALNFFETAARRNYKMSTAFLNRPSKIFFKRGVVKALASFFSYNQREILIFFFNKIIFFKFFIYTHFNHRNVSKSNYFYKIFNYFSANSLETVFKSAKVNNFLPNKFFFMLIKKKIIKIFNHNKFNSSIAPFYANTLLRFLENISGKKILIKFYSFVGNVLTFDEKLTCLLWAQKLKNFRQILGPRLFLSESLEIIFIALKLKDPYLLSNWIINMFQKISFWKFKLFFRYLRYIFRYFFFTLFSELRVKGIKFQLKGKISVAGNARTRTIRQIIGKAGYSTFRNKVVYDLNLVKTFTGVQGLKIWIFF